MLVLYCFYLPFDFGILRLLLQLDIENSYLFSMFNQKATKQNNLNIQQLTHLKNFLPIIFIVVLLYINKSIIDKTASKIKYGKKVCYCVLCDKFFLNYQTKTKLQKTKFFINTATSRKSLICYNLNFSYFFLKSKLRHINQK